LKIHGATIALHAGRSNDLVPVNVAATTGDVSVSEVL